MCAALKFPIGDLSYSALFNLFRSGEVQSFPKNRDISSTYARPGKMLHFVGRGYLKVATQDPAGDEAVYLIYGPGDVFPLLPIVEYYSNDISYVALSQLKLYSLPQEEVMQKVCSNLDLSNAMFEKTLSQFATAANNIANLSYKKASDRLIYKLLTMCARYGCLHGEEILIDKIFTHKLIASIIHTSRETVTRELEKLRKKGLVKTSEHQIVVVDFNKLNAELEKPITPYIMKIIASKKQCKKHDAKTPTH